MSRRCATSCSDWAIKQAEASGNKTVGVYSGALGFGYNKDLLEKNGLPEPKCWADLIKPEYKGHIQIANPNSSGTAYTMLATMVQLFGEDKGFEYLKALHKNVNQYTKSGSAPIKAAGLGETTIGIVFMHDAVAQTVAGFPIVTVAPCEGTGYEIGSMSIIKGARNPDAAKKFYDWALKAEVQSRAQEANSFQMPSNKAAKQSRQVARPVDDQADRLRLQEVRLERRAQAPAAEMGQRRSHRCRSKRMRARKTVRGLASDRHPVDGGRAGWALPCCPGTGLDANFFTLSWLFDGYPLDADVAPALFLVLQGQKTWLAPLGAALCPARCCCGTGKKADPLFGRLLIAVGAAGFAYLLLQGFGIGLRGWRFEWLASLFGPLDDRQFGMGYGALLVGRRLPVPVHAGPCRARRGRRRRLRRRLDRLRRRPWSSIFIFMPIFQMMANALVTQEGSYSLATFLGKAVQRKAVGHRLRRRRRALRRRLELAVPRRAGRRADHAARPRLCAGRHAAPGSDTAGSCGR